MGTTLFGKTGDNQGKLNVGKVVPVNWGHAHNHLLLVFRIYYQGDTLDPDFPDPVPPKNIVVPALMPKESHNSVGDSEGESAMLSSPLPTTGRTNQNNNHHHGAA